ncbi:hypothetical protein AA11826_0974 [Komagataeibacter oboediens DSM 11826]|nr:hypothetical protein AA11826_0974 [Komagataeibacter oboediens DSM 11826]
MDRPVRINQGDIRNPPDIQHRDRPGYIMQQGGVKPWYQRRALATGRYVSAAEIMNNSQSGRTRQQGRIANLPRPVAVWRMQDRLAMKPDQVNIWRNRLQPPHRIDMMQGQCVFDGPQFRIIRRQVRRTVQYPARTLAERRRVGQADIRPECVNPFTIGADDGGINPIKRRAAHQPDDIQHTRHSGPFTA